MVLLLGCVVWGVEQVREFVDVVSKSDMASKIHMPQTCLVFKGQRSSTYS